MEDSYTVHRRRKAAARKREKTPDQPRRQDLESGDDDSVARAKMERMVQDTEQMAEDKKPVEQEQIKEIEQEKSQPEVDEEVKVEAEEEPVKMSGEVETADKLFETKTEESDKIRNVVEPRDSDVKNADEPVKKVEPRTKKRVKDKFLKDKKSYDTDSSDTDERTNSLRRNKSPDHGTRPKNRTRSKPRYSTGTEDDSGHVRKETQSSSADVDEPKVRRPTRRRHPSDTDEDFSGIKKSDTFPFQRTLDRQVIKRSASEMKKQIIPLSDDSLIEDFAKAQEDYIRRERGILAPDNSDDYVRNESVILRKRKLGVLHYDPEEVLKSGEIASDKGKKKSWFSWLSFSRGKKEKIDEPVADKNVSKVNEKVSLWEFIKALQEIVSEFRAYVRQNPREVKKLKRMRNACIGELILVIIYCGLGAFVFRFTEGAFETFYKCGVKRVKRDFLDNLWNYSHNMREDDWKSMARRKLMEFEEQLHNAHEAGVHSYSGQKSWTFLNSVSYCLTVITTIGYGHISPRTLAGRAITIVYAIFGIPIFLIILADFGKLFTRGIKFLWAFVRRLYYTGSCRKMRRTGPVQEVMKGVQQVYDFATFRRPSQMNPEDVEEIQRQQMQQQTPQTVLNLDGNAPDTPGTPAMSNFAIDDEFNLPISVAISILLGYIFVGATAYNMFEDWDFFESFYFVFISMSTIGFGDFVPKNPIFMMFSIIYLVFGLALTSMCINVVQTMLSDSFQQASHKIVTTIGFEVPPEGEEGGEAEDGEEVGNSKVQVTVNEAESRETLAPKANPENTDV